MAVRKDADRVDVDIVTRVSVSADAWRTLMRALGHDMTGVVIPAHVAKTVGQMVTDTLTGLGFPQERK